MLVSSNIHYRREQHLLAQAAPILAQTVLRQCGVFGITRAENIGMLMKAMSLYSQQNSSRYIQRPGAVFSPFCAYRPR